MAAVWAAFAVHSVAVVCRLGVLRKYDFEVDVACHGTDYRPKRAEEWKNWVVTMQHRIGLRRWGTVDAELGVEEVKAEQMTVVGWGGGVVW